MERAAFHYDLPPELIAQAPLESRSASRLLVLNGAGGQFQDRRFSDFVDLLEPHDLLVFNDTRVLRARFFGKKASGGRIEILLERITGTHGAVVQIKASRSPKARSRIELEDGVTARIERRLGNLFQISMDRDILAYVDTYGQVPLPPYIARSPDPDDEERYQTVYARTPGAVAAPTAGLHFDTDLFDALAEKGVECAFLTLHIGAGTFAPVRSQRIEDHVLHEEWLQVPASLCRKIDATRSAGGRIVAVGTTTVRSLETAALGGVLKPFQGASRLFIYPGFKFRVVDALVTNFHLPESSLVMLVCAFAGYSQTMAAYGHAVREQYRFFSYGDAMFVARAGGSYAV